MVGSKLKGYFAICGDVLKKINMRGAKGISTIVGDGWKKNQGHGKKILVHWKH